jgi:hypothetical protein
MLTYNGETYGDMPNIYNFNHTVRGFAFFNSTSEITKI